MPLFKPGDEVQIVRKHKSLGDYSIPEHCWGVPIKIHEIASVHPTYGRRYHFKDPRPFHERWETWLVYESMIEHVGGPW